MSVPSWTFTAGKHALQAVWLYTNGTLEKLPMVFFTVQNGIDNFDELTADSYEEIATSFQSVYADLLDRTSDIETFLLNGLNYTNGKTVLDQVTLYNEAGNAVLTFNGTNYILNRGDGNETILTNVNNLADLANYIETNVVENDLIIFNGTNYVNITKTAFLASIQSQIDTHTSDIADRELISNKVQDITSSSTVAEYPSAAASWNKLITKVDKAFTIAGLDMQSGSITKAALKAAIGEAGDENNENANGLLSYADKTLIDVLRASYSDDDGNSLVDTIKEVLAAFDGFPETTDLMAYFATKVDKEEGKGLSENDLTDELKTQYDDAVTHANKTDGTNPHLVKYANLVDKPTTYAGFGLANGSVETIEATTHVKTPKLILATGVYVEYNSTDGSIDFVIE